MNLASDIINYATSGTIPANYELLDNDLVEGVGEDLFEKILSTQPHDGFSKDVMDYITRAEIPAWYDLKNPDKCNDVGDDLFDGIVGRNMVSNAEYDTGDVNNLQKYSRMVSSRAPTQSSSRPPVSRSTPVSQATGSTVIGPSRYLDKARNLISYQKASEAEKKQMIANAVKLLKYQQMEEERKRKMRAKKAASSGVVIQDDGISYDPIISKLRFSDTRVETAVLIIMNRCLYGFTKDNKYLTDNYFIAKNNIIEYLRQKGFDANQENLYVIYGDYKAKYKHQQLIQLSELEDPIRWVNLNYQ